MVELNDKLILTKYLKEIAVNKQLYAFAAWLRDQERFYEKSGAILEKVWQLRTPELIVNTYEKLSFIFELLDDYGFLYEKASEDGVYNYLKKKFVNLIREKTINDLLGDES
jgi:hypothetical protein